MSSLFAADTSPILRVALGTHLFLAAYLMLNAVGHQVGVLWKAHRGTLGDGGALSGLLAVGAGLFVAAAAVSWSLAPMARQDRPEMLPAVLAVLLLAAILGAIAWRYGLMFLTGSILLTTVDLVVLTSCWLVVSRGLLRP